MKKILIIALFLQIFSSSYVYATMFGISDGCSSREWFVDDDLNFTVNIVFDRAQKLIATINIIYENNHKNEDIPYDTINVLISNTVVPTPSGEPAFIQKLTANLRVFSSEIKHGLLTRVDVDLATKEFERSNKSAEDRVEFLDELGSLFKNLRLQPTLFTALLELIEKRKIELPGLVEFISSKTKIISTETSELIKYGTDERAFVDDDEGAFPIGTGRKPSQAERDARPQSKLGSRATDVTSGDSVLFAPRDALDQLLVTTPVPGTTRRVPVAVEVDGEFGGAGTGAEGGAVGRPLTARRNALANIHDESVFSVRRGIVPPLREFPGTRDQEMQALAELGKWAGGAARLGTRKSIFGGAFQLGGS